MECAQPSGAFHQTDLTFARDILTALALEISAPSGTIAFAW